MLRYQQNKHFTQTEFDRKVFGFYCGNERGENILIEHQKVKQKYFKDWPVKSQELEFSRFFEAAEILKLTTGECQAYEESLKHCRDLKNVIDTALASKPIKKGKKKASDRSIGRWASDG